MRYRSFGNTGESISELSLGCMRFPNEETARSIVNRAIDLGINYFETSVAYCGGQSEVWLGKALADRREFVMVSTKSHSLENGVAVSADEVRRSIDSQLKKLGIDYLDFYHGWSVSRPNEIEAAYLPGGFYDGVLQAKKDGLIRHIGITTHATPKRVLDMVNDGRWETITVQYSLLLQGYREVVRAAHEKGIGIIIMGPLAGGLLAQPSALLKRIFEPEDQVPGALRYVLSDPGVSSVASGMMSFREVEENCEIIDALPEPLSMDYQTTVNSRLTAELGDDLSEFEANFCGGCRYCLNVCPQNIGPHNIFKVYNLVMLKGMPKNPGVLADQAQKLLDRCIWCGACRDICPQSIYVPEHLERVRDYFRKLADGDK